MLDKDLILFVVTQIAAAAGVYAAIRADLREHQVRIGMLEEKERRRAP